MHPGAQRLGCGGIRQEVADHGQRIGAGGQNLESALARDASDGDQGASGGMGLAGQLGKPIQAYHGVGVFLAGRGEDGAESQVVGRFGQRGGELRGVVSREAQRPPGSDEAASLRGGQVVLADVQARIEEGGDVGAVVDDEQRAGLAAEGGQALGAGEQAAREMPFVAELQQAGAAFEQGFRGRFQLQAQAGQRSGVQDGVQARKAERQANYDSVLEMKLHIKSPGEAPGVYPIVRRGRELRHLSFTVIELGGALHSVTLESGEEELALDFYTGPAHVEVEWEGGAWSAEVGARRSLKEPAPMIYVPAGAKLRLAALDGPSRIVAAGALGKPGAGPVMVGPEQAVAKEVGRDNWTRTVYTHIADNVDAARLITGETVSRPGGWSSCPPHKHDRLAEPEVPMEEVYYFQVEPRQGFGFIRVYTDPEDPDPFDYAFAVEHGDTVLIPRGYHPVACCPGYTLNYAWFLAGERRRYGAWKDDPRHAWIKG